MAPVGCIECVIEVYDYELNVSTSPRSRVGTFHLTCVSVCARLRGKRTATKHDKQMYHNPLHLFMVWDTSL
jgi:hypothetical protein